MVWEGREGLEMQKGDRYGLHIKGKIHIKALVYSAATKQTLEYFQIQKTSVVNIRLL